MRLSDILKKAKGQSVPSEAANAQPDTPPAHLPSVQQPLPVQTPEIPCPPAPVQQQPASVSAEVAYTRAIVEIRDIIACVQKGNAYSGSLESVSLIIEQVRTGSDDLLMLADRSTPDVYLYGHSVNTAVFAVMLGHAMGLAQPALFILGASALLHDLGLAKNLPIALKNGKLSADDLALIKKHSIESSRMVALMTALSDDIKEQIAGTILHVHERKSGAGYPAALKGDEITQLTHIIAVADSYESMSHPRPYHERMIPHEALKSLIEAGEADYDPGVMRAFIVRLSLYPPASYVRLNSEEIARVIGINCGMPTRPKVKVLVNAERQRPAEPKIIDLSSTPMLFVKEAVDESKLALSDKKLSLELKAMRWWVKGL